MTAHGRLRFQRVRTAHRSVPLVHDLLTNIADSIVVCTGSKAGNGNIVDRAALRALKFIYGTLPHLIRHHASMRLQRTHARLNTVQLVCSLGVVRNQVRSAVVSFLGTQDPLTLLKWHAGIYWRPTMCRKFHHIRSTKFSLAGVGVLSMAKEAASVFAPRRDRPAASLPKSPT